jgi:hypothetical protein
VSPDGQWVACMTFPEKLMVKQVGRQRAPPINFRTDHAHEPPGRLTGKKFFSRTSPRKFLLLHLVVVLPENSFRMITRILLVQGLGCPTASPLFLDVIRHAPLRITRAGAFL